MHERLNTILGKAAGECNDPALRFMLESFKTRLRIQQVETASRLQKILDRVVRGAPAITSFASTRVLVLLLSTLVVLADVSRFSLCHDVYAYP